MARHKKFEDIAAVLREKILTGKLKPGQDFPSTLELIKEFEAHPVTIQNAVNALVREGLIITFGSGIKRRIVRPVIERSVRRGGFLDEFGSRAKLEILELDVTRGRRRLPETVFEAMEPPVLIYRTRQWRDGIPVALSDSFIPGNLPVYKLKTLLSDPGMDLYRAMKSVGLNPVTCEESLIASPATPEEEQQLFGASVVQRIKRKVFDSEGNLLEFCLLTDRADCYEFVYRFQLTE